MHPDEHRHLAGGDFKRTPKALTELRFAVATIFVLQLQYSRAAGKAHNML
jgi:hypothetical protein